MSLDQITVFALLAVIMVLFVWGRFRYDLVAFGGLIVAVIIGLVPSKDAFDGFSSSAVITVAAVLVISRGLELSGVIDRIARFVVPHVKSLTIQIGSLSGFAAALSAIMNNVGALALLMPATLDAAKKLKRSPSLLLMPLSFGSILGGLITLIGTPPNIIIAAYREEALGAPFQMFDFTPVGAAVALTGVLYLTFIGWRLLPSERASSSATDELFEIDAYVAEVIVTEGSPAIGQRISDLDSAADAADVRIAGLIRGHQKILHNVRRTKIRAKDVILLEAGPTELDKFAHKLDLEVKGDIVKSRELLSSEDVILVEAVVSADSRLIGRVIGDLRLKSRHGLNLLGVSRRGKPIRKQLHKVEFQSGDVLLLQALQEDLANRFQRLGMLPLAERKIDMGRRDQAWIAALFLGGAVALASFGVLSLTIALAAAAFGMVLLNIVPLRELYDSIDWPVIVLVGAMIPIGGALVTTGSTELIADLILLTSDSLSSALILTLLLVVTMTLSDVMNNVATAVVMAPVGISIADQLSLNPDAFLMAVAVGASSAFLTPIGHKNNALVMGPGGYHFGDYWRMGLPLEVVVVVVSVPAIVMVFPLSIG